MLNLNAVLKLEPDGPCRVCSLPGKACSRCYVDYYCGPLHQRQDWLRHKAGCGVVGRAEGAGGALVATKPIPAATVVLRELPAIVFPNVACNPGWLICRGCCREIGQFGAATYVQCSACGLPLCKANCDFDGSHRDECQLLQQAGYRFSRDELGCLTPDVQTSLAMLRVLKWSKQNTAKAQTLHELKPRSQGYLRSSEEDFWQGAREWMRTKLQFGDDEEETLKKAFSITRKATINLQNSHAPKMKSFKVMGAMVVYVGRSLISHGCMPNVFCARLEEHEMETVLVAARDLAAGELLVMDHCDHWFKSAEHRRLWASEHGGPCPLCADPAALGLHLDSWTCTRKDCKGLVVPLRGADSEDEGGRCQSCGLVMTPEEMSEAAREAADALEHLEQVGAMRRAASAKRRRGASLGEWEEFLRRYEKPRGPLHPTHWIALRAKKELVFTVAGCLGAMGREHTTEELVRWEKAFRDVLRALGVLKPGLSNMATSVNIQFVKLLCIRLMHLHQDGFRGRKLQVLLEEANRVLKDLTRVPRTSELETELQALRTMTTATLTLVI